MHYRVAKAGDQSFLDDMNVAATFGARMPEENFPKTKSVMRLYPHIAAYSADFGRPGDHGLIASGQDGEPVGAVWGRVYERNDEDGAMQNHPFEITVAVRESMRGHGIGRQLLDSFAVMAWLKGNNELSLGVHVKNPARKLYESAGYTPIFDSDGQEMTVNNEKFTPMLRKLDVVPVLRATPLHIDSALSHVAIALRGLNHTVINRVSTTTYHVKRGEGTMIVDGVEHALRPGVIIEIPPNTPYRDEGNVDMEAVSIPPFNSADVEVIN